jgi:hypothetical protein
MRSTSELPQCGQLNAVAARSKTTIYFSCFMSATPVKEFVLNINPDPGRRQDQRNKSRSESKALRKTAIHLNLRDRASRAHNRLGGILETGVTRILSDGETPVELIKSAGWFPFRVAVVDATPFTEASGKSDTVRTPTPNPFKTRVGSDPINRDSCRP